MSRLEIRTSVIVVGEINTVNKSQVHIEVYSEIMGTYSVLI